MLNVFCVSVAIVVAVYMARGALDSHANGPLPVWGIHSMSAWAMITGGGTYAVGIYDWGWIREFSWPCMTIIIVVTWCWLWLIRADRAYLHLVNAIHSTDIGRIQDEGISE
jgi:hypothetical protein